MLANFGNTKRDYKLHPLKAHEDRTDAAFFVVWFVAGTGGDPKEVLTKAVAEVYATDPGQWNLPIAQVKEWKEKDALRRDLIGALAIFRAY